MSNFSIEGPRRTLFGNGSSCDLGKETELVGASKALVIADPNVLEAGVIEKPLKSLKDAGIEYEVFSTFTREPEPSEADEAAAVGKKLGAQAVIGIGGGSALDLAKAASVLITNDGKAEDYIGLDLVPRPGLPGIMVPTTAGTGSEVTFTAVFTRRADQMKGGINGRLLYPHTAILDAELTVSCPPYITAITGMDALTHAMEAYTSRIAHPMSEINALNAIELIGDNLRQAVAHGENRQARENMLLGSYLAGLALAQSGVGAVHAMAYPLGSFHDIPHGEANALLLPYVLEFNLMACPDRFAAMAYSLCEMPEDLSTREAAEVCVAEIYELSADVGVPATLAELNLDRKMIPAWAEKAMTVAKPIENNPRKVSARDLEALYETAFGPK